MSMILLIGQAVEMLSTPHRVLLLVAGVLLGIVIGALPGLTVTMATSLLGSLTFGWELYNAMALIVGVYMGGVAGAAIGSIFINVPGTPAAIATTFDGYPLTLRGEGGIALGISAIHSFLGGLLGMITLAVASPIIAAFALRFGPPEIFFLAILAMTLVGSLSGDAPVKGLVSAAIGVQFALVGMDSIYGIPRFSYGNVQLAGGLHFIPSLIGLMGMSEVLLQLRRTEQRRIVSKIGSVFPSLAILRRCLPVFWPSLLIGIFVGALPGVGGETANMVAYGRARRAVKNPTRPFGTGAYEGVAAAETAANACIGGDWIPMLTLGIPGDSTTAVIMGILFIHGLRPGPLLLTQAPGLLWYVVVGSIIASCVMLAVVLSSAPLLARVVTLRKQTLMPIVLILCVAGSYALESRLFHVYQMFAFGVLGVIMRWTGFPIGPMVLGIILGEIVDSEFRRSLILGRGDFLGLLANRPIALFLALCVGVTLTIQTRTFKRGLSWVRSMLSQEA